MYFSQVVRSGAALAALVLGTATVPAQAQDMLRVVDAQGHQVGVLVPAREATPPRPDITIFDALDRMMARDMAIMEATDRELMAQMNTHLRPIPTIDQQNGNKDVVWQRMEAVSIGGPAASCMQSVTVTSNGHSAPIVKTSSSGGKACSALDATLPASMRHLPSERGEPVAPTLVPAVDTQTAPPANEHAGKTM